MPKRRNSDPKNHPFDDDPIDLTGAFAPTRGPQSVDYDQDDDPVGLTQAFGVAVMDGDERPWSEAEKWKNFDWDSDRSDKKGKRAAKDDGEDAEDAAIERLDEDVEEFLDDEDAVIDAEESPARARAAAERSARERRSLQDDIDNAKAAKKKSGSGHGRHAAPEPELSPRMKKSKRTRRVLIVLVILLVVALGALCFYMYRTFFSSQQEAVQQTQEQIAAPREEAIIDTTDDAVDVTTRLADVPNLAQLIGMTQDEAIAAIGRGGMVTANREVNEEGNPVKVSLSVALTEEVADSKTGTPTVYLDLGEDGRVRQAGYSASASALGFGSLSFADAVSTEHVVEKTLAKTGIDVPEGSAVLPADKEAYTAYGSDGTTVVREQCSFEGDCTVNGIPCVWSSILSYDYTTQVITGNLTDTVRVIYVYVSMK